MNKYELTTLKKKNTIINTALTLFQNSGFTNVSIKDIAKKANVSQVSIYNYFGSKDSLVFECTKIVMEDTFKKANTILKMDIPFIDKVEKALLTCTESINISISKNFTETALNDSTFIKLLSEGINKRKREIYKDYIELGKKENVISNNISTETILAFMGSINNIGYINKSENISVKEINDLHHLFLFGIVGKK